MIRYELTTIKHIPLLVKYNPSLISQSCTLSGPWSSPPFLFTSLSHRLPVPSLFTSHHQPNDIIPIQTCTTKTQIYGFPFSIPLCVIPSCLSFCEPFFSLPLFLIILALVSYYIIYLFLSHPVFIFSSSVFIYTLFRLCFSLRDSSNFASTHFLRFALQQKSSIFFKNHIDSLSPK